MERMKNRISLILMIVVYLLFSVRYFQGDAVKTLVESVLQILYVAPLPGGATIILVSFIQKTSGEKIPLDKVLRIYLTLGIMAEFFFGLYNYLDKA